MLGRTHLIVGIFFATFFTDPFIWIIIVLGSLLPDIDSTTSLLGRRFKIVGKTFEHRGFFHSLFLFIPLVLIGSSYSLLYGLAVVLGVGSHLFLDACTKQGLRIYPFRYRIRGFIRVSGFAERVFSLVIIILILFRFL